MSLNLVQKNIVILGIFKPVVFDKLFFLKNNLAKEDDFLANSVFIPDFSRIETNEYIVEIAQNRIVINSKNQNINNNIQKIAVSVIDNKDSTITAIGYNLKWLLIVETDLNEYSKSLFFAENNKVINKYFNSDDTAYGYYVSKNYKYCRLKLDVKPSFAHKIDTNEQVKTLAFDFNFHIDNIYDSLKLKEMVLDYENFISIANEITSEYE